MPHTEGRESGSYDSDGAQGQDPGDWPESEREAALGALPDETGESGDQVDQEAFGVSDPDDSSAEEATR